MEEHAARLDWLNKELAAGDKFLDKYYRMSTDSCPILKVHSLDSMEEIGQDFLDALY